MREDIFQAAFTGNDKQVKSCLEQGSNPATMDENGFTPLHYATMGCNTIAEAKVLAVIDLLLKAGSPVNATSKDGRTALYLAAEFSPTLEPLKILLDAGARADICDTHGNHIVTNTKTKEAREFLSKLTGHPVPQPLIEFESVKLSTSEWHTVKAQLDKVFDELIQAGLIVMQDAGTTQQDGFSDCAEIFRENGGAALGFCFYTRQDLNQAKRTSQLPLAFWGAPDGADDVMLRVGRLVVDAFRQNGFVVGWNNLPSMRPTVYLQNIGQAHG